MRTDRGSAAVRLSVAPGAERLNAAFPLIKAAWNLSRTKLDSRSSVVALIVGVQCIFPPRLLGARQRVPLAPLRAEIAFAIGPPNYTRYLERVNALREQAAR